MAVTQLNTSRPSLSGETSPNPELLSSLGRLMRGLSLLFWGLPLAIVTCWQTAQGDWFRPLGITPPILSTGLLLYSLQLLAQFQRQERVWHIALERCRLLACINLGLSPFLYWFNQMPHPFFSSMAHLMFLTGLIFLYCLNPLLWRLAAMLPDETLRDETKLFTTVNRYLLLTTILMTATWLLFTWLYPTARIAVPFSARVLTVFLWASLFLFLLPVAMTMALVWKIKEAIFASIFGTGR